MATAATISVELNLDMKNLSARVIGATGALTAFNIEAFADKKTLSTLLEKRKQVAESTRAELATLTKLNRTAEPAGSGSASRTASGTTGENPASELDKARKTIEANWNTFSAEAAKVGSALASGASEVNPKDFKAQLQKINEPAATLKGTPDYHEALTTILKTEDAAAIAQRDQLGLDLRAKTAKIDPALLDDPRAARQAKTDNEIGDINTKLALYAQYGAGRKAIEADVQAYIQALQEKTARENETAFGKTLRDWRDVTTQLGNAASGWLTSASDELTTFVMTGKANFANLAQSIIKDLIRISIQTAIGNAVGGSGIFGLLFKGISFLGGAVSGGGGAAPINDAGIGTVTDVAVAHTGGIMGRDGLEMRNVLSSVFDGARRFHTGGMPGLSSGEVPAILRRGEGVFTEGQMAALGAGLGGGAGGAGVTVANTFNIQAGAGSGDTTKDQALAQQIGAQVTNQVRGLVVDELYRQGQPGGLLYGR